MLGHLFTIDYYKLQSRSRISFSNKLKKYVIKFIRLVKRKYKYLKLVKLNAAVFFFYFKFMVKLMVLTDKSKFKHLVVKY